MTANGLTSADFGYISDMLRERAAIVLDTDKTYLVETRLGPLIRTEGIESIEALVDQMRRQTFNGLHKKVIEAMTTNETSFYRDLQPFEALKKIVVPELIESRQSSRALNFWCAASSSGQEPYTVVMTLLDHFPQLNHWRTTFIASDISDEMIVRCKNGSYSQLEVNRGLPAMLMVKYFKKEGTRWQIDDDLRKKIDFKQINLIEPWPTMPKLDIVFIRNVLIYFDVETKRSILTRIRSLLRPDGFLFLGGAETTLNIDENFERIDFPRSGCYRLKKK